MAAAANRRATGLGAIDRWAAAHHGVITMRRACILGWTRSAWYRAIDRGEIELLHPGVARVYGSEATPVQRIHAAVMAAGRGAMASHRSAALLWGIERPARDPVDVLVPRSRTRLSLRDVVVHRPTDRADLRPSERLATPSSNLLRTLIDLGAVVGNVDEAVSAAITSGAVTPMVLEYLLARHARPGRHGSTALRSALAAWPLDGKPADSELEVKMASLLQRYELPPATFHAQVAGFEVDFLINGSNLVLECDGWDHHGRTRDQFDWARERDVMIGAAGFIVRHFTWRQITRRPAWSAEQIRLLLARWSPDVLNVSSAFCRDSCDNPQPTYGAREVGTCDTSGPAWRVRACRR